MMKLTLAITLLPAVFAHEYLSSHHHHHHHSKYLSTGVGTAPYGSGNGTATFGSSGLLSASTGTAGKAIYSTVVLSQGPQTKTVLESGSASLNEAGATLPAASSCPQATVTVTEDSTVTVTVSAPESGVSESVIPTQAPVPTQAGTSSPLGSVTPSIAASPSVLSPKVQSTVTLAGIGAGPSSSPSTFVAADAPQTVSAVPLDAPASSSTPVAKPTTTAAAAAPESVAEGATSVASAPATNPSKAPKRGIIVSQHDTDAITAAFANTRVSWLGNWYSGPPPNLTPDMGMEYVPQLYSPQYIDDGSWASNAPTAIKKGAKYFMSFGEPLGSGMSAATGVKLWMETMEPYAKQGIRCGTPANLQNPKDMQWLGDFMELCEQAGCTIGFVTVHWFWTPGPNGQQDFMNAVGNATSLARGKPVWVDNFGALGSREKQIEFLKVMIPWLEKNDAIERYGYLAINRTQGGFLPEEGNELSDLGQFYATF